MLNRQWLFGFGAGLVFSAGFLYVFPPNEDVGTSLSQEQLQAEAASLQMVMIPKTEYDEIKKKQGDVKQDGQTLPSINEPQAPQTQAPVQPQAPGSKPAEPPASTDKPQPSTVQSPTSAKSPASSQVHTIAASSGTQPPPNVKAATVPTLSTTVQAPTVSSPSPATSSTAIKETTVKIPGGATSTNVAAILTEAGILSSQSQFVDTMNAQKKQRRIRAGTYKIPRNISLDDLIKLLTTPPKK